MDDCVHWIRMLDNALLREGISPSVAFKASDLNHNGVVSLDELRDTIKRFLSEDSLTLV
jgi:Ca2+-binding EF-hand superfamily protein